MKAVGQMGEVAKEIFIGVLVASERRGEGKQAEADEEVLTAKTLNIVACNRSCCAARADIVILKSKEFRARNFRHCPLEYVKETLMLQSARQQLLKCTSTYIYIYTFVYLLVYLCIYVHICSLLAAPAALSAIGVWQTCRFADYKSI